MFKPFQFNYFNASLITAAHRHSAVHKYGAANLKALIEECGFTESEAVNTIKKNKPLIGKETADLIWSYKFCRKIGLTNEDLLNYPGLLVKHPLIKINHYNTLQDIGCNPIDAKLLSRAAYYFLHKLIDFKTNGYLKPEVNIVNRILSTLDPPIETPKILKEELSVLDNFHWGVVHKAILVDWLKLRLNITEEDVVKLLRIHRMIKNKSFRTINENIKIAESLDISRAKILKCGYLLNNYPEYPKVMLSEYPNFAGIDIAKLYKINPKLMMVNPRKMMEIYDILKEYDIKDEMIQKKADVFSLSPITLRERLNIIVKTPEYRVHHNNLNMLNLVVHQRKVQKRLMFLKKFNFKCSSVNLLTSYDDSSFESYIQTGKDYNTSSSVITFFCQLLDKNRNDIAVKVQKHPYYCNVPFLKIEATFHYLIKMGYTKENIYRLLIILLYPCRLVRSTLSNLKIEKKFKDLSQYKQLSLVLYHIEKKHHFTGNGVWETDLKKKVAEISEEKTLE